MIKDVAMNGFEDTGTGEAVVTNYVTHLHTADEILRIDSFF